VLLVFQCPPSPLFLPLACVSILFPSLHNPPLAAR
jgi:hypothetical protein